MRPAMQLASSPGMVSSVIAGRSVGRCGRATRSVMSRRDASGKRGEAGAFRQFVGVLREEDAQRGEVVLLAGHGVAENHRRAIEIQRPLGIAVVFQRFARAGDGPFLRHVHGVGHARRNRQVPLHRLPGVLAHPAADLRIRLVGRGGIGVVIELRVPTVRRDFADAVAAVLHVFPESRDIRGVGQDGSHPHNGDGSISSVFHDDVLFHVAHASAGKGADACPRL